VNVVDTSVAVAAALPWHAAHAVTVAALQERTPLLGHVAIETYSVLTRLPAPQRVAPALAHSYLTKRFTLPPIVLPTDAYAGLIELVAAKRIAGGAVYDALVGVTAREAGAILLTLDRRAVSTYQLLGLNYRLLV
jgi:predicted nucleic acid-binding protein